jgi:carbamoyltransferase
VEASQEGGVRLLCNHEEGRFLGQKHCTEFPREACKLMQRELADRGLSFHDVHAVVLGWDYQKWAGASVASVVSELPWSLRLLRGDASPVHFGEAIYKGMSAAYRLKRNFRLPGPGPVIHLGHHENHAYFSFAASPFSSSDEPVIVLVVDGSGDVGAISSYVARNRRIETLHQNDNTFDSLGLMYGILSSSQGGWPALSSEGRFMGAAAWGNMDRLTNPFYSRLRNVLHFGPEGRIYLNRALADWHRGGCARPYTKELSDILGPPIPPEKMWNPDAVLRVEDIEHAPITRERVDKAAAVQLVFEDGLFHIVSDLIRQTGSNKLVLSGGTALNCVANMRIVERFDDAWYARYCPGPSRRLHVWAPPTPNDEGVAAGAAIHFASLAGAPLGKPGTQLNHAFYCGRPASSEEIERALEADDIGSEPLGNIEDESELLRIADLLAFLVSRDAVVGLYQGAAETGPRALGHRSILANPTNPETRTNLNSLVKFRELIRPLAPMATLEAALEYFELSPGASDADYNAYNYMILTAPAREGARDAIPAVIHHDGTGRVQIVRKEVDPFCYAYLKAMGRRVGVEVSVNTSLNVGTPIVQAPEQALEAIRRSSGMHGLVMIAGDGAAWLAWHNVRTDYKDEGETVRTWLAEHQAEYDAASEDVTSVA